ncbi:hypothetical protein KA005_11840 [bacterium]|nr:hypothetical protein [bacterium]
MDLVEKLEKWISEHPEEADVPTINMTTGKESTIRETYELLKKEKETGTRILDKEVLEMKKDVEKWVDEL